MAEDIRHISTGGVVYGVEDAQAREDNLIALQQINHLYEGRDLTVVFANEIAKTYDEWAWIRNRIEAVNYAGIYVGDYIPFQTTDGIMLKAQIAGIDTYYGSNDVSEGTVPHHIDFISKECLPTAVAWTDNGSNNGSAENGSPYMISTLKTYLNDTVLSKIPSKIKNHILSKTMLLERRYSSTGELTKSQGEEYADVGELWVPSEYEVFGSPKYGTKNYSEGLQVQYPIFAHNCSSRIKKVSGLSDACYWWLLTVSALDAKGICHVDTGGACKDEYYSRTNHVPVCFRIASGK